MFKVKLSFVCAFVLLLVSCASHSFIKNSYRALVAAETTYDSSLTAAAQLYKDGHITDNDRRRIITVAKKYKAAYALAKESVIQYETIKSDDSLIKAQQSMAAFIELSDELTNLMIQILQEE